MSTLTGDPSSYSYFFFEGTCDACKSGCYEVMLPYLYLTLLRFLPEQLCPDIVFAATPPFDGTLGRYYSLPADLAYVLPDNVSLEDGAMVGLTVLGYMGSFLPLSYRSSRFLLAFMLSIGWATFEPISLSWSSDAVPLDYSVWLWQKHWVRLA